MTPIDIDPFWALRHCCIDLSCSILAIPQSSNARMSTVATRPRLNLPDASPDDPASLTYETYFRLREKPFSLSPNPRFFYNAASHSTAFGDLLAGIRRREGILALTGEVGTGKTTLCRAVLESLDRKT